MLPKPSRPESRPVPRREGPEGDSREPGFGPTELSADRQATIGELLPYFTGYCLHEWNFAPSTAQSYLYDMRWIARVLGDIPPGQIRSEHILLLKAHFARRGSGPAHVRGLMYGLKAFLRFCQMALGIETLDPAKIRGPKVPRREVVFLEPEEMRKFLAAIPIYSRWHGRQVINVKWLGFRAFCEVLRGTGMRVSEALSLTRGSLDFEKGQAKVVGKGNKERTVFFSQAALAWTKEYLNRRLDTNEWLFALKDGRPAKRNVVQLWFQRIRERAGIEKKVTAHIFRHTFATTLLMNGAPIGLIKELLGHEMLETTCKFYLGTDKRLAKSTLDRYLDYEYDRKEELPFDGSAPGYGGPGRA